MDLVSFQSEVATKDLPAAESSVEPENFRLFRRLGEGKCLVYEEASYHCALKLVDASKQPEIGAEVH